MGTLRVIIISFGGFVSNSPASSRSRAETFLSEAEREPVLERLQLAREFIGAQDPLDFFRSWKTPSERYKPLAERGM
jgi:hypothetical protein